MAWDWQGFCKEETSGEVVAGWFGRGGDIPHLSTALIHISGPTTPYLTPYAVFFFKKKPTS